MSTHNELLEERRGNVRLRPPKPYSIMHMGVGRANFWLYAHLCSEDRWYIGVGLTCGGPNAKVNFRALSQARATIDSEVGAPLEWNGAPDEKSSYVQLYKEADVPDRAKWPEYQGWMADNLEALHRAFHRRLAKGPGCARGG